MKRGMAILMGLAALTITMTVVAQDSEIELDSIALEDDFNREGERCINVSRIRQTHATDDRTVLFYMRGGDVYRNTLQYECRGLERENRISYRVTGNRLCSVDTIAVLRQFGSSFDMGIRCGLGRFFQITDVEADFLRYGERSEMQEEPEVVELPNSQGTEQISQDASYGIDEYNNEADYNYEC